MTAKAPPRGASYYALSIISYIWSQWFILGLGLAVGLAAAFPYIGMTGGTIRAEYSVKYVCIGLIFLITGLSISELVVRTYFEPTNQVDIGTEVRMNSSTKFSLS